jgi:hypothetical protein
MIGSPRPHLPRLWKLYSDIEAEIDAYASTPEEIGSLEPAQIVSLIEVADHLSSLASFIKRKIGESEAGTEGTERVAGFISGPDHPMFKRLEAQRKKNNARAAKISRRRFRLVPHT